MNAISKSFFWKKVGSKHKRLRNTDLELLKHWTQLSLNDFLKLFELKELETKLKEVAANGGGSGNVTAVGSGGNGSAGGNVATGGNGDNVGKRMATKFLAQVEIKESGETSRKQSNAAGTDKAENPVEKKEVRLLFLFRWLLLLLLLLLFLLL